MSVPPQKISLGRLTLVSWTWWGNPTGEQAVTGVPLRILGPSPPRDIVGTLLWEFNIFLECGRTKELMLFAPCLTHT